MAKLSLRLDAGAGGPAEEEEEEEFWLSLGMRSLVPATPRPTSSSRPSRPLRRASSMRQSPTPSTLSTPDSPATGPLGAAAAAAAAAASTSTTTSDITAVPLRRIASAGWGDATLDALGSLGDGGRRKASPAYVRRLARDADSLAQRGRHADALVALDRILLLERPAEEVVTGALFARSQMLLALRRFPEVIDACRGLLRRRPGHWRAQVVCGDAHYAVAQHQQAVRCYKRALQLAHTDELVRDRLRRAQLHAYSALVGALVASERKYVGRLEYLVDGVMLPVRARRLLSEAEATEVFANAHMLLQLNQQLLSGLEAEAAEGEEPLQAVLAAFAGLVPYFRMYASFCGSYESAVAAVERCRRLHPQFDAFVATVDPALVDLLALPVQRLARYGEFFDDLLDCATSRDPEHAGLAAVALRVRENCSEVSRRVQDMAARHRLMQVAARVSGLKEPLVVPDRRLLLEASVEVAVGGGRGRRRARQLLLFSDMILLGKFVGGDVKTRLLLPLSECVADDRTGDASSLFLFHKRTRYTLWASADQYAREGDCVERACPAAVAARLFDAIASSSSLSSASPASAPARPLAAADWTNLFFYCGDRLRNALRLALSTTSTALEFLFVADEFLPSVGRIQLPPPREATPAQVRKDLQREVVLLNGERYVGAAQLDQLGRALGPPAVRDRIFAMMSRTVSGGDAFELVFGLLGPHDAFRLTCPQSEGETRSAPIEVDLDAATGRVAVRSVDLFEVHETEDEEAVVLALEVSSEVTLDLGSPEPPQRWVAVQPLPDAASCGPVGVSVDGPHHHARAGSGEVLPSFLLLSGNESQDFIGLFERTEQPDGAVAWAQPASGALLTRVELCGQVAWLLGHAPRQHVVDRMRPVAGCRSAAPLPPGNGWDAMFGALEGSPPQVRVVVQPMRLRGHLTVTEPRRFRNKHKRRWCVLTGTQLQLDERPAGVELQGSVLSWHGGDSPLELRRAKHLVVALKADSVEETREWGAALLATLAATHPESAGAHSFTS